MVYHSGTEVIFSSKSKSKSKRWRYRGKIAVVVSVVVGADGMGFVGVFWRVWRVEVR